MSVSYDEKLLGLEDIRQAVEKAGYQLVDNLVTESYDISGMTCASCAMTVEKALGKLEGVEEVTVNLATEKATIRYSRDRQNSASLERAVEQAGYQLIRPEEVEEVADKGPSKEEKLWHRFVWSAVFTLPCSILLWVLCCLGRASITSFAPSTASLCDQPSHLAHPYPLYRTQFFQKALKLSCKAIQIWIP